MKKRLQCGDFKAVVPNLFIVADRLINSNSTAAWKAAL